MKRAVTAALTLVIGALGVACDDEPVPRITPTESSSAPPSEPTTPATTEPAKLSPEETVRAWVEARNITVHTGDVEEVQALSSRGCDSCEQSFGPVRDAYQAGGRLDTPGWRLRSVKRRPDFPTSREVATAVVFAAGRTFPSAGAKPIEYPAEKHVLVFRLRRVSGQWLVDQLAYAS